MPELMTMNKRKVLIISYVWPPMEGVGLIRAMKFAKYLPGNGWEPMVLTVKSDISDVSGAADGIKVFRTEYRDVIEDLKSLFIRKKKIVMKNDPTGVGSHDTGNKNKRALSFIREMISIPDDQIGWYKFAVEEGRKIVVGEGIDLIMSTSPPETAHLIGRALKRAFNIPWIADLRDLWADDHFRERPFVKRLALRHMEKRVLKDADMVITVSEPWAMTLRSSLGAGRDKVEVIENGFDEEDFGKSAYGRNKKFTISYTGKLHGYRQPVGIFFKVLADLIREGHIDKGAIDVKFHAMGYDKPDISGMAASYGLSGVVSEPGKVGYRRSLEIQRASDVLLFVQWQGRGNEGWYSAKLYDYIGSRRPILALAKKTGIVADLITRTSSGILADNEADLRDALLKLYNEYKKDGSIKYYGNEAEIAKHSRRARAEKLAALLDSVAGKYIPTVPHERRGS